MAAIPIVLALMYLVCIFAGFLMGWATQRSKLGLLLATFLGPLGVLLMWLIVRPGRAADQLADERTP